MLINRRQKTRVSGDLKARVAWLTEWLNGWEPKAANQQRAKRARARILAILNLIQKLESALRPGTPLWQLPNAVAIEAALARLTRRYKTWPRFGAESDASGIGVAHMWERGSLEETMALKLIEELLKSGLLANLTFCETCKYRWLFRNGEKGKYCSTKCRQAPYERSPGRRAKKAERNREYYERWLKSLKRKKEKRSR